MSLESILDAVAVRLAASLGTASSSGTPGLRAAYSAASTSEGAGIIPRSIDDWPVAILWAGGGEMTAGNGPEPILHGIEVRIWCGATDAAYAYQTLVPFVGRCRTLFRTDVDANATAARVLMTAYDAPEIDEAHGKPFLVLAIHLEALEFEATDAYAM